MKVYFIGMGGSGMLPLAKLAREFGHIVAGSDPRGAGDLDVFANVDPSRIDGFDSVVYSSAIPPEHPELQYARSRGEFVKVYHRMDFLTEIMRYSKTRIGIAGTHGKTSTTSLLGWVLLDQALDPTIFAGGKPLYLEEGMRKGNGPAVFETDESDGSFLRSNANFKICLNVDEDHLEHYGTYRHLIDAFRSFASSGTAVLNGLDSSLANIPEAIYFAALETGQESGADYTGRFVDETDALVVSARGSEVGQLSIPLPGRHFASNALGVFALLDTMIQQGLLSGLNRKGILESMSRFPGVERRMERIGTAQGSPVFDDYGHHPSEIAAVIRALRVRYPDKRVKIVFQPHRYTRTRDHASAFAEVLKLADEASILPLYSAGEKPIDGIDSEMIARQTQARLIQEADIPGLLDRAGPGDVLLFQGAGDISSMVRRAIASRKST